MGRFFGPISSRSLALFQEPNAKLVGDFLRGKFDGCFFFSDSLGPKVVVFLLDEYIGGEICDCGIFFGRWRGQITSRSGNERKRKFHFPWYVYYCIYIYT